MKKIETSALIGLGALGDADGEGLLVDVQHVAALGVELAVAAEVQRDVLVVGVVLEDVLAVQGLAVAGDRVHAVEVDALADDRERVAGEVEVGHKDIPHPVTVRYGWDDNPVHANLKNRTGLPASPFQISLEDK